MSSTILAAIARLAEGSTGSTFEEAARQFNALPLYEGWYGWGILTPQGEILEADDEGNISPAKEPMRTMFLVVGTERYPELVPLLPQRPAGATDCAACKGSGWVHMNGRRMGFRCGGCRALGWLTEPSNNALNGDAPEGAHR
jgi:hypothetical protein